MQAHELPFALCVVVLQRQHTTVRTISHRAQVHELFILATTAKNVDDKALMRKRAQAHELLITAATTTYVDDEILRASA